jgi:hypothetical protein
MPVMNVAKFERFFRAAASLDVDHAGLKRYNDFLDKAIYNLLLRGQANAKTNDHEIIWPSDLPITRGLQESIHAFREIDEDIELQPILEGLTKRPPLDVDYSGETEAELPGIAGGLSLALARSFRIIDPKLKNPMPQHWKRPFKLFDLLL